MGDWHQAALIALYCVLGLGMAFGIIRFCWKL